jgi:nitroreductase
LNGLSRGELKLDVFDAIKNRRSVRKFLPDDIPKEDINLILESAACAPSAANAQPWKFLIVKSSVSKNALKDKIKTCFNSKFEKMDLSESEKKERSRRLQDHIEDVLLAPVLIFVFVDAIRYPDLVPYDGALAVQNLMLAAHALGYGTCFLTTIFPEKLVTEQFCVPENYRFVCGVPIGRASAEPKMPDKKPLSSFVLDECFSV